jgi:hypothetical protein
MLPTCYISEFGLLKRSSVVGRILPPALAHPESPNEKAAAHARGNSDERLPTTVMQNSW